MKKQFYLFALLFFTFMWTEAQVAVNEDGSAPNPNAMLDVSSTTKGILIPRMDTSERTALQLSTTEKGMFVYDTDTHSFWYWDGVNWNDMGNASMNEDKDWYKEGTTDVPGDITDNMFHTGNVAIGRNAAAAKLDVYQDVDSLTLKVENANPDDSAYLRTGAFINVGGVPSENRGKIALNASVGGVPGDHAYSFLIGVEADVAGPDGGSKGQFGLASDVGGNNDGFHVGTANYMHGNGNGVKYGTFNNMSTSGDGIVFSTYDYITDSGNGMHLGAYRNIGGGGDGNQFGAFNRIYNGGNGYHFGVVNQLATDGTAGHIGTFNLLGAGVLPNDPHVINAIPNDSDAKRVGTINMIAGPGGGIHVGETNNIISTGDGFHVGVSNILGYDYIHDTNTSTNGYQLGTLNNLTDTGGHAHVGTSNLLGLILNPSDPLNPVPVTDDSDAKRVGTINTIAGPGGGIHVGESNNIISTGDGLHIGVSNVLGYDYLNNTNTTTDGYQVGTLNNLTDLGSQAHVGTSNVVGMILNPNDPANPVPVSGDGAGKRAGEVNMVAGDGDGEHYGIVNAVMSTGDGDHIASYNKVTPGGAGKHIAVYGEVDDNDPTAMAGVFKGDVTARNYVSTIQILSGVFLNDDSTDFPTKSARYIVSFDPTAYHKLGAVQIKVVINITGFQGNQSEHHFRVKAVQNNNTYATPIADTDTWTWTQLSGGNYIIESEWKTWNAGTDPWSVRFQIKNDNSNDGLNVNNIYYIIRPAQP